MLYLIPNILSDDTHQNIVPEGVKSLVYELKYFIVEDLKSARRYLKRIGYPHDFDSIRFDELNEHNENDGQHVKNLIDAIKKFGSAGLISEAGVPAVADPGKNLIGMAHRAGLKVVPLVGPSSILMALMASGLNGQRFSFQGYLPKEQMARRAMLVELEAKSYTNKETIIFIETPYRNHHVFEDICAVCAGETLLCIAAEITSPEEDIRTRSVSAWKKDPIDIAKKNCVFLMLKI